MSNYIIKDIIKMEEEDIKYLCDCGAIIKKINMETHVKTKRHLQFVIL